MKKFLLPVLAGLFLLNPAQAVAAELSGAGKAALALLRIGGIFGGAITGALVAQKKEDRRPKNWGQGIKRGAKKAAGKTKNFWEGNPLGDLQFLNDFADKLSNLQPTPKVIGGSVLGGLLGLAAASAFFKLVTV